MANLDSVSARELSGKVKEAVDAALRRNEKFRGLKPELAPRAGPGNLHRAIGGVSA